MTFQRQILKIMLNLRHYLWEVSWRKFCSIRKNNFCRNTDHENSSCFPTFLFPVSLSKVENPTAPKKFLNDAFCLKYIIPSPACIFLLIIHAVVQNESNITVVFPHIQLDQKFCWWLSMNFLLMCITNVIYIFSRFELFVEGHSNMRSHRWRLNENVELKFSPWKSSWTVRGFVWKLSKEHFTGGSQWNKRVFFD